MPLDAMLSLVFEAGRVGASETHLLARKYGGVRMTGRTDASRHRAVAKTSRMLRGGAFSPFHRVRNDSFHVL